MKRWVELEIADVPIEVQVDIYGDRHTSPNNWWIELQIRSHADIKELLMEASGEAQWSVYDSLLEQVEEKLIEDMEDERMERSIS